MTPAGAMTLLMVLLPRRGARRQIHITRTCDLIATGTRESLRLLTAIQEHIDPAMHGGRERHTHKLPAIALVIRAIGGHTMRTE